VRTRGRTLTDDDVELVVFEGGVELFFEDRLEAVDFVEEEHLPLADVGEDGGEVALDLQGRAGGLLKADVELIGDDCGQSGFAEAGRAEEQDVVEGFTARAGRFEGDGKLFFGLGLADEFIESARAKLELEGTLIFGTGRRDQAVGIFLLRRHSGGVYMGVYRVRGVEANGYWINKGRPARQREAWARSSAAVTQKKKRLWRDSSMSAKTPPMNVHRKGKAQR